MFSHLLIATDFSKPARLAARTARALAVAYQAEVTLLHVVDRDDSDEIRENSDSLLEALRADVFDGITNVNLSVVEHHHADVAICAEAAKRSADLIIAARHGEQTIAEHLLGSTTERVARRAHCSVLVAHPTEGEPFSFAQHVVACSDLSEHSQRAIEEASELATRFVGKLTLAHVYTVDVPPFAYGGSSDKRKDAGMEEHAKEQLEKLRQELIAGREATFEIREHASAVDGICDYAEAADADLIVVGTRGRSGLRRLLIGSVAERVIRHAPCSVLVARR